MDSTLIYNSLSDTVSTLTTSLEHPMVQLSPVTGSYLAMYGMIAYLINFVPFVIGFLCVFYALFWGLVNMGYDEWKDALKWVQEEIYWWFDDELVKQELAIAKAPLTVVKRILKKQVQEEGMIPPQFISFFRILGYPVLWMFFIQLDLANIFLATVLAALFYVNHNLFIDLDKTHSEQGNNVLAPKEGVPSQWAEYYAIQAMQWGDERYLQSDFQLEISPEQFLNLAAFSFLKLFLLPIVILPMSVWSALGSIGLFTTYQYDTTFLTHMGMKTTDGTINTVAI